MAPPAPADADRVGLVGERIVLAASLAAAVVFVSFGIERSVWQDEAATILISHRPFSGVVEGLHHENNFPLYFFLLSLWMRVFGTSEIALRALSSVFYATSVIAAFALGKRVCRDRRAACYGAFFYFCSPLAIRQAQNIRMYGLLGTLSALSLLAFIRLFRDRDPSWRARVFFAVVNALGILTHIWFAFVLIAQFLALLVFARKQVWTWMVGAAAASVPFLILWAPSLSDQIHNGATDWMPPFRPWMLRFAFAEFYGGLPAVLLYLWAIGAFVWAGRARRREMLQQQSAAWMLLVFTASFTLPLVVSVWKPIYWPGRYAVIALAPLAVLMGTVVSKVVWRPLLPLLCIPLITLGLTTRMVDGDDVLEAANLPRGQSDRTTSQFLLRHAAAGDAVVFTSLTRAAADYYFLRAGAGRRFDEISFPAEVASHPGWMDPSLPPQRRPALEAEADSLVRNLRPLVAAGGRVWLYDGYGGPVTAVVRQRLDAAFPFRTFYPLEGPYHKQLVEYAAPALSAGR